MKQVNVGADIDVDYERPDYNSQCAAEKDSGIRNRRKQPKLIMIQRKAPLFY